VVVKVVEPPGASVAAHCWLVLASNPTSETPSPSPSFATTPLSAAGMPLFVGMLNPYG
jgi:hypothetical protein